MDHVITELDYRFDSESSTIVVEFMKLLPSSLNDNTSSVQARDFHLSIWEKEDIFNEEARTLTTPEKNTGSCGQGILS